jgi:hypothetical protein
MADTYPWSEPADSADDAQRALQAVQFALDRRDNGGDARAAREHSARGACSAAGG